MKIGYIGLGLMGKPCTMNLMKAGHELYVWGRRPETTKECEAKGAKVCKTIADVARESDILFLNVTNTEDVHDVLFREDGVASSGKKGLLVVDMSTISATATREMARELEPFGITLVDAPVSGGTIGAANATLTFMVGASSKDFERIRPALECMGKTVTRIGECGAGQVAKSCNQIAITGTIAAVAEAVHFAQAAGVDPAPVREALMGGFAGSTILKLHGERMITDNYTPGFKTCLHLKDIGIVTTIADELGLNMPVTVLGKDLLQQTVDAGYGEEDSAAMFKVTCK